MKRVSGNLDEIRDWHKRVMNNPVLVAYGDADGISTFPVSFPWHILIEDGSEEAEIIGDRIDGDNVAVVELLTDTFAIVDNALIIIEVNECSMELQLYIRAIVPSGSSFDADHVRALTEMGLFPVDAMRIVATS